MQYLSFRYSVCSSLLDGKVIIEAYTNQRYKVFKMFNAVRDYFKGQPVRFGTVYAVDNVSKTVMYGKGA